MSNPSWQQRPTPPSPWSRQDPNWAPPTFVDRERRDPRQPFGADNEQPPQLGPDGYGQPPRKGGVAVVAIGIIVALVVVVLGVLLLPRDGEAGKEPTPVAPKDLPTVAYTSGNQIPFEGNGTGVFTIDDYSWQDDGLHVDYTISVESGQHGFVLFAFTNTSMEITEPTDLSAVYASPEAPYSGTAIFPMPREAATIVLTSDSTGESLTALSVPG